MSSIETTLNLKRIEDIGGEEGKNSTVWKGYDEQLNAYFAVKEIKKDKLQKQLENGDRVSFFDEARKLYNSAHPNVVSVQHSTDCKDNVYISMPYYKNGSLNSLMNQRFLTVREIIKYSLDFLGGVHFIHTNNLTHFDIKPTNILFNDNMKAMIADFGLSKYTDKFGLAKYTVFYRSHFPPECYEVDVASKAVDIYQAGLTLYRMCNGNNNYKTQFSKLKDENKVKEAILKGQFPNKTFLPHIPKKLRRIINKALKTDPDDRYATILDMMNDISKVEENLDILFRVTGKTFKWEIETSEPMIEIIQLEKKETTFILSGKKRNKSSGIERNIAKLNEKEYDNIKEAFKVIEQYLSE